MEPHQLRVILAENIRAGADKEKMALNHLADLAGVSRSQLYDVLASRKAASVDWIAKLAQALEIPPSDLLE